MAKEKPWERQATDTDKSFEAFTIYRDMGVGRSLEKVGSQLGKSPKLMERWSRYHGWVERAAQWDAEQDRIKLAIEEKERIEDIKRMRKKHADIASAMIMKSARALNRLKEEDIKPSDISRMIEVASKLERLSRGDVGDVIEERDGGKAASPVTFYIPSNNRETPEDDEE